MDEKANSIITVLEGVGLAEVKRRYRSGKLMNGSTMRRRSLRPNLGGSNSVRSSGMTTGRRMKRRKQVDDKHDIRTSLGRDGGCRDVDVNRVSSKPSSCDSMGESSPRPVER